MISNVVILLRCRKQMYILHQYCQTVVSYMHGGLCPAPMCSCGRCSSHNRAHIGPPSGRAANHECALLLPDDGCHTERTAAVRSRGGV
jgi:hypothetical protein